MKHEFFVNWILTLQSLTNQRIWTYEELSEFLVNATGKNFISKDRLYNLASDTKTQEGFPFHIVYCSAGNGLGQVVILFPGEPVTKEMMEAIINGLFYRVWRIIMGDVETAVSEIDRDKNLITDYPDDRDALVKMQEALETVKSSFTRITKELEKKRRGRRA